jgi:hypothetical protein
MTIKRSNPRKQGDIGVGVAISWFMNNDYSVSIPISESQRYDLIVEKDKNLQRVQVKTSTNRRASGSFTVILKTNGGNQSWSGISHYFDKTTSELLFILTDTGEKYLIPTSQLKDNAATIDVGHKWKEYLIS